MQEVENFIQGADHILILQADNPDADSLGSSLALEQILSELGKKVSLYCGVDMPQYLRYISGWDRVSKDLPEEYDLSIMVDVSTRTLFEILETEKKLNWLAMKPCIVLDHHADSKNPIDFANVSIIKPELSSTGELIYELAKTLKWPIDTKSGAFIMNSILGDTQGLSNDLAKPATYRVMAELLELGVDRVELEEKRREYSRMPIEIFRYKAKLIERSELFYDNIIALVTVPYDEIVKYSPLYNPAPLIQSDLAQTRPVGIVIVLKIYPDKITGFIRCNRGYGIAKDLAEQMGGGGHQYAAGFKFSKNDINSDDIADIKSKCLSNAGKLMNDLPPKEEQDETIQYSF